MKGGSLLPIQNIRITFAYLYLSFILGLCLFPSFVHKDWSDPFGYSFFCPLCILLSPCRNLYFLWTYKLLTGMLICTSFPQPGCSSFSLGTIAKSGLEPSPKDLLLLCALRTVGYSSFGSRLSSFPSSLLASSKFCKTTYLPKSMKDPFWPSCSHSVTPPNCSFLCSHLLWLSTKCWFEGQ